MKLTKEFILNKIPSRFFVKNHPMKIYVDNVSDNLPSHIDINNVVFVVECNDIWRSPIAEITEDGNLSAIGCAYCISQNHKYDMENGVLYVSGLKAIPISRKVPTVDEYAYELDKFLFLCPYCSMIINRWAKKYGIVSDVEEALSKEELSSVLKEIRGNNVGS
jgi:hypothetical protein